MNFEFFIARRLLSTMREGNRQTLPAVRICIVGIALSLAVMIIAIAVILGFKKEIRNKVEGFEAHIQVVNYQGIGSFESVPVVATDEMISRIKNISLVKSVEMFATKPAVLKTDSDFISVVVKGIPITFDTTFLSRQIISGRMIDFSNAEKVSSEVVVSKKIADKVGLNLGETIQTFFIEQTLRERRFKIVGFYQTDIAEYDEKFIFADLRHVQRLNNWADSLCTGLEVRLHDFSRLSDATDSIYNKIAFHFSTDKNTYHVQNIRQTNEQMFSWLDLLDINAWVILLLMLGVAGFDTAACLIILIIERTSTIGTLKSFGISNSSLAKIFKLQGVMLLTRGLVLGNLLGYSLVALQAFTHFLKLDAQAYYISYVPMEMPFLAWAGINIFAIAFCALIIMLPVKILSSISPIKTIKFD